jgi:membrane protein implicated in regulation of membrane protease activity
MANTATAFNLHSTPPARFVLGFLFWAAFLLVLEPGNVARAAAAGYQLSLEREALRIVGATIIGGASTPAVYFLAHRYPVSGSWRLRNALCLLFALIALAGSLIVVSCFAAAWVFESRWFPEMTEVGRQLVGNLTLLTFALASLTTFIKATDSTRSERVANMRRVENQELRHVLVRSRRQSLQVEIDSIDWVEAQGNYVGLHVGRRMHLLRETLTSFQAMLDEQRFARVHRSAVVAVDRIKSMKSTENGGAVLRLHSGQELPASRRYRKSVREKWTAFRDSRQ